MKYTTIQQPTSRITSTTRLTMSKIQNQVPRVVIVATSVLLLLSLTSNNPHLVQAWTTSGTTTARTTGKCLQTQIAPSSLAKRSSSTTTSVWGASLSSLSSSVQPGESSGGVSSKQQDEESDAIFLNHCKELCDKRNIPFDAIKNARDLASVANSPVRPGRVYRMGRVSDATANDITKLEELNFRTLVDLRSPTELKDDPTLQREEVFRNFIDIVWKQRGKDGCLRELNKGESPIKSRRFWKNGKKNQEEKSTNGEHKDIPVADLEIHLDDDDEECHVDDCPDPDEDDHHIESVIPASKRDTESTRKERHFVSLMNEFKYVKGTVSKVRKRDITKAILKSPGAVFSKRVRDDVKKPFLDEINDGGLPMLNELLLRFGAPGIKYVLELVADTNRHPVAFYCTAGKDRTGMLAAIILALCGVKAEDIVEDYALSANVYAEMNDHKAMVGALSQRNLDPKTFLGAPPQVMKDTLIAIDETYGSVEGYCEWIGFSKEKQEQLRRAMLDE